MPRLDERRRGEPFDVVRCADRRLARKPTVEATDAHAAEKVAAIQFELDEFQRRRLLVQELTR